MTTGPDVAFTDPQLWDGNGDPLPVDCVTDADITATANLSGIPQDRELSEIPEEFVTYWPIEFYERVRLENINTDALEDLEVRTVSETNPGISHTVERMEFDSPEKGEITVGLWITIPKANPQEWPVDYDIRFTPVYESAVPKGLMATSGVLSGPEPTRSYPGKPGIGPTR
jgi:hypothetical protein